MSTMKKKLYATAYYTAGFVLAVGPAWLVLYLITHGIRKA